MRRSVTNLTSWSAGLFNRLSCLDETPSTGWELELYFVTTWTEGLCAYAWDWSNSFTGTKLRCGLCACSAGPLSWVWPGSLAAEILNRRSQLQCKTMEPLKKHEWVNFFLWVLFFSQHFKSWVRNLILQNIWWRVHLFFPHQSHLARCGRVLVKDNCGRQWQREFCYSPNWSGRPRVALMKTSSH